MTKQMKASNKVNFIFFKYIYFCAKNRNNRTFTAAEKLQNR